MKPHRVIGFRAISNAGYDCSFAVMFPMDAPANEVNEQSIRAVCQQAVNDASRMHGGITVKAQHETVVMMN